MSLSTKRKVVALCFCACLTAVLFTTAFLKSSNYSMKILNTYYGSRETYNTSEPSLVGLIWPTPGVLENRISNQLEYIKANALNIRNDSGSTKVILRVGNFNFIEMGWVDGDALLTRQNCPITNCRFTSDESEAKTAHALLISEFGWSHLKRFSPKPAHQIWIAQHFESPLHNRVLAEALGDLVNWTVSYRFDSTIASPYASWEKLNNSNSNVVRSKNYASGKTKKVAWIVSNCDAKNGRREYATELGKFIDVDVYGRCGRLKCTEIDGKENCHSMLKKDYKFYLAFENSNCDGYITEKFHTNGLKNDVIPIAMGARPQDYAAAAPPGSYIHVDDFESPRHLAEYLKLLDSNDTLYNEYFRYKQDWRLVYWGVYWCRLCALLHIRDKVDYVHWYHDYGSWWNGVCDSRWSGNWQTWRRL